MLGKDIVIGTSGISKSVVVNVPVNGSCVGRIVAVGVAVAGGWVGNTGIAVGKGTSVGKDVGVGSVESDGVFKGETALVSDTGLQDRSSNDIRSKAMICFILRQRLNKCIASTPRPTASASPAATDPTADGQP